MGIGIYQPYLDRLREFALRLQSHPEIRFVIAGEIQSYNSSLNSIVEKDQIENELVSLGSDLEREVEEINVHSWDVLTENERYQTIKTEMFGLYEDDKVFNRQVRKLTSNKAKVPIEHPEIDTMIGYALEEIASIFYFAELGYTKAGHQGERDYDKLAVKTLRKNKEKLGVAVNPEEITFLYVDHQ
jgi:hypothetical protein